MVDFVYLDNHTACKPFAEVMEKWKRFSDDYWASASSLHFLGQQQIHPIQKSLDSLFLELGLGPQDELVLTKEGLSSVLLAVYLQVSRETGKTLFLTAQGQEGGNLKAFDLIEQLGCQKKLLPFNEQGQLTRDTLSSFLTAKTALVSLPWANGLTGVIHPVLDLLEACSEKKVLVHLDATYMLGKQFFRFQDLPVDFLTLRGAALYAPKGAEIILVKKGSISCPFSIESTALLGAYSSAVQAVQGHFEVFCTEIARLKDRLEQGLCEQIARATVFFQEVDRLCSCFSIAFEGVHGESLLYLLNLKGVYATCGGGVLPSLSQVLMSAGIAKNVAVSAISFALSLETTEEEVDYVIQQVAACVHQLRTCFQQGGMDA